MTEAEKAKVVRAARAYAKKWLAKQGKKFTDVSGKKG